MKEIVITNPNGITLHTKKSLVNDDIKIKLDKSIKAVDGVIQGNEGQLLIDTPKEKPITISGDHDEINITNGNVKLNLNAYTEITLSDNSEMNLITADGLAPENIKKDVNILGVTGTFEGGSSGTLLKPVLDISKTCRQLFYNYKGDNLKELISYNDTENVTDFYHIFDGCENEVEFPHLNTSKGTNFDSFYYACKNGISFPPIDIINANSIASMYSICNNGISFPPLNTSNITSLYMVYNSCYKITKIDLSHFNISDTNGTFSMCNKCYELKALIIRSFGDSYVLNSNAFNRSYRMLGQKNTTYNPNGEQGYVYVPRDMISVLQNETNWSTLQFRALEDYTKDGTCDGEFDDEKAGI